jgi:membrane protease YdiL (CAAX protease family)
MREPAFRSRFSELSDYQASGLMNLLSLLCTSVIIVSVIMLTKPQSPKKLLGTVGWNGSKRQLLTSSFCGGLLGILFSLVSTLIYGNAGYFRDVNMILSISLFLLSVVLLQPLVEEIYFRGILFVALVRRFSEVVSIAIVTLTFALMHPGHRLDVLPISIVLGIVRLKTDSVACCFALHASYNCTLMLYQVIGSR